MGHDLNSFCRYHMPQGHKINDWKILKRDMDDLIQRDFLKSVMPKRNTAAHHHHDWNLNRQTYCLINHIYS